MTHICVSKLTIIGSDNGLSLGRRQAIIWTKTGILLIGPLGTNFNETSIKIQTFSFKKIHLKVSSEKWRSSGLGLSVINGLRASALQYLSLNDSIKCNMWIIDSFDMLCIILSLQYFFVHYYITGENVHSSLHLCVDYKMRLILDICFYTSKIW